MEILLAIVGVACLLFFAHAARGDSGMSRSLLTFLGMGIVSIVAVWIVLTVLGALLGLTTAIAGFLLFRVAPIMLAGWLVLKLVSKVRNRSRLSAADRKWLEDG